MNRQPRYGGNLTEDLIDTPECRELLRIAKQARRLRLTGVLNSAEVALAMYCTAQKGKKP